MYEKTHLEQWSEITARALRLRPVAQDRVGRPMMDTVLFTDHGILVFAITCAAAALLLSVLGLATTYQIRSDIIDQFRLEGAEQPAATIEVLTRG